MTVQDQVSKLQSLLDRIRQNSHKPRGAGSTSADVAPPAPPTAVAAPPPPAPAPFMAAAPEVSPEPPPISYERIPVAEANPALVEQSGVAVDQDMAPVVELADEEIVEIEVEELDEAEQAAAEAALEEEEAPPSSTPRPKLPGTMDEALANAAERAEEEREVPIKTPPPESGRQVAMPLPAELRQEPPPPDLALHASLEADLAAEREALAARSAEAATAEQIGETVSLSERAGPDLELGVPVRSETPEPPAGAGDEFELPLPVAAAQSAYDESLAPPSQARSELERHRELEQVRPPGPGADMDAVRAVVARAPLVPTAPVAVMIGAEERRAATFLELLDAALTLGNE